MQPDDTAGERLDLQRRWRRLPWLVLLLVLGTTAALAWWSASLHASENRALLERRAEAFGIALSGRVQAYVDTLPGLRQFAVLKSAPTDLEFSEYVQAISLQQRFPGLALTFFGERVQAADRQRYVEAVRADRSLSPEGHPGWSIQPAGERAEYMVLRHVLPVDPVGFGYDLYDPAQTYRTAVDRAIDSGGNVATGPLLLARDRFTKDRPELTSVVIRMPLYAGGVTPDTVEARRANARGVAGISFNTQALVASVLTAELRAAARIRIVDAKALGANENALVLDSDWGAAAGASAGAASSAEPLRFAITVADRSWDITVTPRAAAAAIRPDTWLLLALGGLLAVALALMTHALVDASRQAEARVRSATAQVVTERDALEKSEARYRKLFENSHDAMLRTRPDGTTLAANRAATELFGWSEEQLCERGRVGIVDPDDSRLSEYLVRREQTGVLRGLLHMLRADGTRFEAECSSTVYVDLDGQLVTSLIVRDVTEREQARERQARLTAILDSTPDFVGSTDAGGGNLFLNKAWRRVLGRTEGEDLSSLRLTDCYPAWAAQIIRNEGIPLARQHGLWAGETAILAADGSEIPVAQVILCHRGADGEVTHSSTIARDLSAQIRADAERRGLERQLRESQKMESLGTLAGGVAHDFNNVLAAILGNAALAAAALEASHPAQQNLALLKQAASRARTLVQQILTFSRRTTQQLTVQALGPVVDEALALLRSTLPPTVLLKTSIPDAPIFVLADSAQIQQVVMNLCTNACQALPDGRGSVEVSLDAVVFGPDDVAPNGLPPDRYARLRVEDDGAGMDAATRERVFEPFFTTKRVGEGTGLGLAVVHGIVTASAGAITIDSLPGAGSRVDVYLPCHDEPLRAAVVERDEAEARGHGEHLLYIDDDEVVSLTMGALLERSGYRVTLRSNGADALAALQAAPRDYALVISDYNMPDMSGLDVSRRVREIAPDLPVVITSGFVTAELHELAQSAGVRAVLLKEYSLERLGGLVRGILHERRA